MLALLLPTTPSIQSISSDFAWEYLFYCSYLIGWRLDYTAAATDFTNCPAEFNEFFNQRRSEGLGQESSGLFSLCARSGGGGGGGEMSDGYVVFCVFFFFSQEFTHSVSMFSRRWIMSTLANIIVLLQGWRKATRNNNSISIFFIAYQAAMLFSTIIR